MGRIIKPKMITKPKTVKPDGDVGISGSAVLTLKDAKTGTVKQQVEAKNMITARGLDWIIAKIVTGEFIGGDTAEDSASTWHGHLSGSGDDYIDVGAEKNPFKYLCLLFVDSGGTIAPDFTEGHTTPGSTLYLHKNTQPGTDGVTGTDVVTYDENLGTSGANSGSSHEFNSGVSESGRTKILGYKLLPQTPNALSVQSNEDGSLLHFQKVSIVFNFATNEGCVGGTDTINSIAWANSADCDYVGARLQVSPGIQKTSQDTLDITYTFDLAVS